MKQEQKQDLADKKSSFFESGNSSFPDYKIWQNYNFSRSQLRELCSPAKHLWLNACQKAVRDKCFGWLEDYAKSINIDQLPRPWSLIDFDDNDSQRKHAAIFVANCALGSLYLEKLAFSAGSKEFNIKFVECLKRAITSWDITNNSCVIDLEVPPIADLPVDFINQRQYLKTVLNLIGKNNTSHQTLPTKDLICYFLNEYSLNNKIISTAKFPLVIKFQDRTKIGQLEIERFSNGNGNLYRDSISMASCCINDNFQQSIHDAFEYTKIQFPTEIEKYDFRWCVIDLVSNATNSKLSTIDLSLEGKSVGLAAAIAFNRMITTNEKSKKKLYKWFFIGIEKISGIEKNCVFTGSIDKTSGKVENVSSYPKKIVGSGDKFSIFLPKIAEKSFKEWSDELNYKVNFVDSVADANRVIRNEKLRAIKKIVLPLSVPILILIVIGLMFGIYQADKLRKNAQASRQIAYASQLGFKGSLELNKGDNAAARTYFAKALELDDQPEYREGLLQATLSQSWNLQFKWEEDIYKTKSSENLNLLDSETFSSKFSLDKNKNYIAYIKNDATQIEILDINSEKNVKTLEFTNRKVEAIALSPDGKFLAVGTSDGGLDLHEINTGKTRDFGVSDSRSDNFPQAFSALAFSPDGQNLAVGSAFGWVSVSDVQSGEVINIFPKDEKELSDTTITDIAFGYNNKLSFSGIGNDSGSKIVFVPNIYKDESTITQTNMPVFNLAFSRNEELLSSGIGIDTWSFDETQLKKIDSHIQSLTRPESIISTNEDMDIFVTSGDNGEIQVWDSSTKKKLTQTSVSMGKPTQISISKNGTILIQAVTHDGVKLYCWKINKIEGNKSYDLSEDINDSEVPYGTTLSQNGLYAYVDKGALKVRDLFNNRTIMSKDLPLSSDKSQSKMLVNYYVNTTGTDLLFSTGIGSIEIIDIKTFENFTLSNRTNKKPIPSTVKDISNIAYYDDDILPFLNAVSGDGKKVAVTEVDGTVAVYLKHNFDVPLFIIPSKSIPLNLDDKRLKKPKGMESSYLPQSMFFSPDNKTLVIKSAERNEDLNNSSEFFEFYDASTGKLEHVIPAVQQMSGFTLSPDGLEFVMTDWKGFVYLWQFYPYRRLTNILKTGFLEKINSPTFSNDGEFLAWTSAGSGRVHFFDDMNDRILPDWKTNETIVSFQFLNDNKLAIHGFSKFRVVDAKDLSLILGGNSTDIQNNIETRNGLSINTTSSDYAVFKQNELNTIPDLRQTFNLIGLSKSSTTKFDEDIVEKFTERNKPPCQPAFENPIFNPYPLTFTSPAAFCAHYPLIDVRKANGGAYSLTESSWLANKFFDSGDDLFLLMYMSNGAANGNLNEKIVDAKNVKITVKVNYIENDWYILSATFLGDNLAALTGFVRVRIPPGNHLVYSDNVEIYDYLAKAPPIKIINISNAKIQDGKNSSFEIPVGDLKPGFETDLFFKIPVSVKQD